MTDYSTLFTGKTPSPQAAATHLTPPRYRLLLVDDEPDNVAGAESAWQAIKDAGRPGQIAIASAVEQNSIVIRIQDDGVGMTAEQREHAFEPFYTLLPVGAGLGLGLATAHNIVQAHGGEISLDSQPGVGTTVTLSFPVL